MIQNPTDAQLKIFDFVENGTGNGIIDAVAGAGKTTTLMGCVEHIKDLNDVIYCAFNTSIRKELQKKFSKEKKNVKVCTIHSLGFQLLRATKKFTLNDYKYRDIIKDPDFFNSLVPEIDQILGLHNFLTVRELNEMEEMRNSLNWNEKNSLNEGLQYVHKITSRLLDINNKYRCTLTDDDLKSYDELFRHFSIFDGCEFASRTYNQELELYFRAHHKLLKEGNSIAISHGIIDFTDQIYLPFVLNLTSKEKYGFVFVDECQDLSKAQLNVVKQYIREDGRLLAVGDPFQSIYGFAGADCNSFDRVKNTFDCQILPLTDCFRCPQKAISIAKTLRADIKGFKQYDGIVETILEKDVMRLIKAGDLVICRHRAPLVSLALKLVSKNFKVKLHPDEVQEFMGDYKNYFTPAELRKTLTDEMIDKFFDVVQERGEKRIDKEFHNVDSVLKRIMVTEAVDTLKTTLDFLKKKYFEWNLNSLDAILTRLKHCLMYPGEEAIKVSTVHRAKGLENDKVFILQYDKMPVRRDLEWERIQERNLKYVAVTRPKEELYLCIEDIYTDGDVDAMDETEEIENPNSQDTINPSAIESETPVPAEFADLPFVNSNAPVTPENEIPTAPEIPFIPNGITARQTQRMSKLPKKFYSFADVEDTPYTALNSRTCQKAKYWAIINNLQDTEFSVLNVISSQYLDSYHIKTPDGVEIYDGYYNDSGSFRFTLRGNCPNAEQLMIFLNDESSYKMQYEYTPQNSIFESLHSIILASCIELGICITNVFGEAYNIVYCFKTSSSHAVIKVTYNGKGIITTLTPSSTIGGNDEQLNKLIDKIKHIWQR